MSDRYTAILVANDTVVVNALRLLLQDSGFRVVVANESHRAVRLLESTQPHVVVLDVSVVSQRELSELRRVRHVTSGEIPVVLFIGARALQRERGPDEDGFDPMAVTETVLAAVA